MENSQPPFNLSHFRGIYFYEPLREHKPKNFNPQTQSDGKQIQTNFESFHNVKSKYKNMVWRCAKIFLHATSKD